MHFVSPEFAYWFELALKMAVTALFVSVATIIAERLGPTVGALVATLPVSAGPVYVLLAQHHTIWISTSLAFAAWLAATLPLSLVHWTAWSAFALNVVVFGFCFFIVEPFRLVRTPPTTRPWYDFLVRSTMVALLVGAVVTLSFRIGPAGSGVLAVFPVIYTSIMFILHCRVGGPATAAVLANAIPGLAGFGVALLTLHLTVVPLGSATALVFALGVSVAWNAGVYAIRRHQVANEVIE